MKHGCLSIVVLMPFSELPARLVRQALPIVQSCNRVQ
ncbi:hypothetical protein FHY30_000334 [Xanthomonas arboricola]|nr:hypothetical protein [Xanthomonas campestris]